MNATTAIALAVAALQASCPAPSPSPSPPEPVTSPDASVADAGPDSEAKDAAGDIYAQACAALTASGCAEGEHPECAHVLWLMARRRITTVTYAACLAACSTPRCVHACGSAVACEP